MSQKPDAVKQVLESGRLSLAIRGTNHYVYQSSHLL